MVSLIRSGGWIRFYAVIFSKAEKFYCDLSWLQCYENPKSSRRLNSIPTTPACEPADSVAENVSSAVHSRYPFRPRGSASPRQSSVAANSIGADKADLHLRSGTDNYLVHINIGRLLDREHNSAVDRIRRHRELVSGRGELGFHRGFVTPSVKFVRTKPGEMIVTRSLSPASWRKPSEMRARRTSCRNRPTGSVQSYVLL